MELIVGRQYKRSNELGKRDSKTIHGVFGGVPQKGISYAQDGNVILVFTDPAGSQKGKDYADHWDQGVFHYTGEERAGDQEMGAGNDEILRHRENGKRRYVFGGVGGEVPFWGEFTVETKFLSDNSMHPQSPTGNDPQVDILWERNGEVCIGEIKRLTKTNQSRTLCLAIDQVLDYRYQFAEMGIEANCHIIVECKPDSSRWESICHVNGLQFIPLLLKGNYLVPFTRLDAHDATFGYGHN